MTGAGKNTTQSKPSKVQAHPAPSFWNIWAEKRGKTPPNAKLRIEKLEKVSKKGSGWAKT